MVSRRGSSLTFTTTIAWKKLLALYVRPGWRLVTCTLAKAEVRPTALAGRGARPINTSNVAAINLSVFIVVLLVLIGESARAPVLTAHAEGPPRALLPMIVWLQSSRWRGRL